jgi:methyl-accepting chemotaxis protein
VQQVASLLDAIDAASAEQAQGIAGVRSVIADMDEATQQNAAMVEQATAASETMRIQAAHLTDVVGTFRVRAPASDAAEHAAGPRAWSPMQLPEPAYA